MQNTLQPSKRINIWKAVTLKEQLKLSIIKAGYAPSHKILSRITNIKKEEAEKVVEKFYLDYKTELQKLLLQSILLYDQDKIPLLMIERCDRVKLNIRPSY